MVEGDGKRLLLNRLSPALVRTYWRGAATTNDASEIAAAVSAVRDGSLGEKLTAPPGVPPTDLPAFLTAVLDLGVMLQSA